MIPTSEATMLSGQHSLDVLRKLASGLGAGTVMQTRPFSYSGAPLNGNLPGNTGITQFPAVTLKEVHIKAHHNNPSRVFIGNASVAVAANTLNTTGGWPLFAGEESPPFFVANLNQLYYISESTSDQLGYLGFNS